MATATGWTVDYILNEISYPLLIMMLSDAPRYVRTKGGKGKKAERSAKEEAEDIVGFFQSKLTR